VSSGLTALGLRWRVIADALSSVVRLRGGETGDDDPIMGRGATVAVMVSGGVLAVTVLTTVFAVPLLITVVMIVVGGGLLNLIATRAYPRPPSAVRVMGVL
jgi:hypothetical protein